MTTIYEGRRIDGSRRIDGNSGEWMRIPPEHLGTWQDCATAFPRRYEVREMQQFATLAEFGSALAAVGLLEAHHVVLTSNPPQHRTTYHYPVFIRPGEDVTAALKAAAEKLGITK